MASLREIERAFLNAVLFGETDEITRHIVGAGLDPRRRAAIYHHNALATFTGMIAATFPVLERLAGADWLRQVATEYMQRYPSRSGNLHHVGAHLGDYLERRLWGTQYEYFADVARLEWNYQEVLVAMERATLDLERLAAVAAERHDRIVFELAPAARLVASRFPLLAIWRANRSESCADMQEGTVDLAAGPSRVLLIRRPDHVELRELPQSDFEFLEACGRGQPLGHIAETLDSPESLPAILARAVSAGVLVDFHLEN